MTEYIARRLVLSLPTLVGVSLLAFLLVRIVPGDAVTLMIAEAGMVDPRLEAEMRENLGLDGPIVTQYFQWMGGLLQGDLGNSLWTDRPVLMELANRIPASAELALLATTVSVLIGIPAGTIGALYQGTWKDYSVRFISILGLAVPNFWLATLFILLPAIWFGWRPPIIYVPLTQDPIANLQHMWMPATVLGLSSSALITRLTRSAVLEVIRQDYVRTARAKGLHERMVVTRHVLRNALLPVVTVVGAQLGFLLGGTVIIENIFSIPGVGNLTVRAVFIRDFPQVQASIMFFGVVTVLSNLVVDLSYALIDPRIRYA